MQGEILHHEENTQTDAISRDLVKVYDGNSVVIVKRSLALYLINVKNVRPQIV